MHNSTLSSPSRSSARRIQFLPLGSVILIHDCPKRMMIVGRLQKELDSGLLYEYAAVPWPEGLVSSKKTFLIRQHLIERVLYVGMQDEMEFEFRALLEETWPSLLAENGQPLFENEDEDHSDKEEEDDDE